MRVSSARHVRPLQSKQYSLPIACHVKCKMMAFYSSMICFMAKGSKRP
jgi:hypothetical protein